MVSLRWLPVAIPFATTFQILGHILPLTTSYNPHHWTHTSPLPLVQIELTGTPPSSESGAVNGPAGELGTHTEWSRYTALAGKLWD